MTARQPTATAFTRTQESWAKHRLGRTRAAIETQEDWLREQGWVADDFPTNDTLMDLYDEELFWARYGEEMASQREFLRETYLGEETP